MGQSPLLSALHIYERESLRRWHAELPIIGPSRSIRATLLALHGGVVSMGLFSLFSSGWSRQRRLRRPASTPHARRKDVALRIEPLEDRCLLSGLTISGYVYND